MHALLHTLRNDASTRGMPGPRALLPLAVLAGAWLGSPIAGQQPRFQELRRSVPADAGESLSLALADVDGDGDLDALLGNEIGAQLLINDGTAVFRDASSNLPGGLFGTRDVAFGDFDGDGDADVLTTNRQLLLNDGSGQFVDGSANVVGGFGTGTSLALGDLDGDGDLDAVRGLNGGIATVWLNAGHGLLVDTAAGFPTGVFGTTQDAVLGDVDGDGILDLFLARGTQDLLFLGDGAGAFVDATSRLPVNPESTSAAAMADLDGDGDLDLLLSNDDAPRLWLNDGTGAFRDAPGNVPDFASYAPTTTRIVLEDVDGDGDRDAYLAHSRFRNILLLNDGGAGFTDASDRLPERQDATFGMALADLDGDGDVDALLANHRAFAASTQTRLQLNDGSGNFRDVTTEFPNLARSSRLGALGDLDGDGDLDALLAGAAGDFVYENDGTGTFEPDPLALPPRSRCRPGT